MDFFTYFVGALTIVGFILQVVGILKKIKTTRNILTLIFLGMFIGSLISSFNKSKIQIDVTINLVLILEIVFLFIALISIIISYHSDNDSKKEITNLVALVSFVVFMAILVFGNLVKSDIDNEKNKINQQELMMLSKYNLEKQDFERSIGYLEILKNRFTDKDIRRNKIENQIDSLKLIQINLKESN